MHKAISKILVFLRLLVLCIVLSPVFVANSQVYLSEGFEMGARPEGWTEEFTSGTEPWRYRNGGHSPNDNNWLVPASEEDITRNPPSAYNGTYNAIFFKQGDGNERTKLVTPSMDLLGGASIELSFYLCQIPWTFEGSTGWDVLRVYYKVSESSPWILLHEYLDPVYEWEKQTLVLPNPSSTYYVAFEGHTRWGFGTCIDDVQIESTGLVPRWIKEIDVQQPFTEHVPSGSTNVPVLRIGFEVYGNTDSVVLDNISFTSLNTSDNDILPDGVKIYSTQNQIFKTDNPVGNPGNFNSGVASFSNLNHILPSGQSYIWLTYDIDTDISYGNIVDVKLANGSILANDTLYPATEISPSGYRTIYTTQYFEDFEGVPEWILTGEFEVNTPSGSGGLPGNPDPVNAFSGSMVLGTDLTGLGSSPYNYEPDLSEAASYTAISPDIDLHYYKNLNLFFQRYLNIEVWDNSSVQVSIDSGITWNTIWQSNSYLSDFDWIQQKIQIPDIYSRTKNLRIRYKLGPTDLQNNYSGWNIDDIYLTGEFITKDVGISEWIYPLSGSGHLSNDSVTVRISNYGGVPVTDSFPLAYSFDGGQSWTIDYMDSDIPVGGSVVFTFPTKTDLSGPGLRPSVLAETRLPGDQYTNNDRISTSIYLIPTYTAPYTEDFESDEGFWRTTGSNIWEYGMPAGSKINSASSGTESWVTGLTEEYGDIISEKDRIIFQDDFESDLGWVYTGEFERSEPSNMYLPYFAYSGYYCIGTDLKGSGLFPYNYENGITSSTAYSATSPALNVNNYSNLKISFMGWITIQPGDSVKFEVSSDNGASWINLWKNTQGAIMEEYFIYREFPLPDSLTHTDKLRFRFSLFYSSASGPVAQGWSIDDFILTGDLVNTEEAYLSSPRYDLTDLENPIFEARLWTDTEQNVDGMTILYSLDDGNNWTYLSNSSGFGEYWNWYNGKYVEALGLDGWSGESNGWVTVRHLLPSVLINKDNVQFRFRFGADKFNNNYDGIGVDDIEIYEAPHDIGVLDILSPVTACELSAAETFVLRIKNYGVRDMSANDSILIGYHINREGEIQSGHETIYLTDAFLSGETRDFTMNGEFDFSVSGAYETNVFTIEDDPFFYHQTANDTISRLIRVNKPKVDLGQDISTVRPDTIILKAYSGVPGYDYLWQDGSTDSVYHVNTQGTYYVMVTNDIGCVATDTIQIEALIADVGVLELLSPVSACELGAQEQIIIKIKNFGTDTLDINDTIFIYRDINSAILKDTLILEERIFPDSIYNYMYSAYYDFSSPGIYEMNFYTKYTDDVGFNNDTLHYILEVYGYPDVDLGQDTVISASEYVLSATPGYYSYLWQDGSTLDSYTVEQAGMGDYCVTVSDEHQCSATDSVRVTLNMTDIALDRILSPETSCDLSESITVSVRIINSGNQSIPAGSNINLGYHVDEELPVIENMQLTDNFQPGDSIDFAFSQQAGVITGNWYDFTVFVNYNYDMKLKNDTLTMPVGVFEAPVVDLGEDYLVVTALEYELDAGPGFNSYLWHDGSTGQTYTITTPGINICEVIVTDANGCFGYDRIEVMLAVPDIGITEIINPVTSCTLDPDEQVTVAIKNLGNWDIDQYENIQVAYSINGNTAVKENVSLSDTFEKGSVIYHTFASTEDLSLPANYEIVTATSWGSDMIQTNDTIQASFTVYGLPVVSIDIGQDTILTYDPVVLSVTPGYVSYLWQDGSSNTEYEINSPGAGTYRVMVTDNNGCSNSDSVYVVYDLPDMILNNIVAPVSSCELDQNNPVAIEVLNNGYYRISGDDSVTISYSVNNGTAIVEEKNLGTALLPGEARVITFSTGYDFSVQDSYSLDVSLNYSPDENLSNNTLSNTINVWGYPEVEIGDGQDTIKTSLPLTLDAGTGYSSYLWQDGSVGNTNEARQWDLYWVIVTDEHGCPARDSVYVISPYSVDDINLFPGRIKIYPNPVSDILHLMIETESPQYIRLELFNMQSNMILRKEYEQIDMLEEELYLRDLSPGPYFLRVITDKSSQSFTIVVKK